MDENEEQQSQGHPAWQEILDELPEELHPLITPKLQAWDQGVQQKLQEARAPFDPYKPLVDNNIPLEVIQQALWLAQEFENNPETVVEKAIESFNLERFKVQQQIPPETPPGSEFDTNEFGDVDLSGLENHPVFQQLKRQADELAAWKKSQEEAEETETAATELEEYLESLHTDHGEFNDLFVTALMANGLDAVEAIQTYQETVKSEASKLAEALNPSTSQQPPVVVGGAGNSGSGIPDQPVSLGRMGAGDVSDLVTQMIEQANNQNS